MGKAGGGPCQSSGQHWTSLKCASTPRENQGLGAVVFIYQPLCGQEAPAGPTLNPQYLYSHPGPRGM